MESVDEIILHQLRSIDAEVDDDVESLRDLTTDGVYRAIASCLRVICPDKTDELPRHLPPSMSARYGVCGKAAEMIKNLRYRGDIGYQTILYCSETDIRNVLVFLIEKLPREHVESHSTAKLSNLDVVMKNISSELAVQINRPWIPPRYRTLAADVENNELETVPMMDSLMNPKQGEPTVATGNCRHVLSASIVDALALIKSMESRATLAPKLVEPTQYKDEVKAAVQAAALLARIAAKTSSGKAAPAKASPLATKQSVQDEKAAAEEEEKRKVEQAQALRDELQSLKEQASQLLTEVATLGRQRGELDGEVEALASEIEQNETDVARRELIAGLLPNADENMERLQAATAQRRAKLDQLRQFVFSPFI